MSDAYYFVAGVAVSIPVSVGANLYTPRIGAWLARRSTASAARQAKRAAAEGARLTALGADSGRLQTLLLEASLRAALVGAIAGIAGGLLSAMGQALDYPTSQIFYICAQILVILGAVVVVRIVIPPLRDAADIRRSQSQSSLPPV